MASNEAVPETSGSQVNEKNQGLMLSYRHHQKKVVNKIRDRLRKQGYDIWIDQEKMAGSLKTKMTEAVKKADIVLICLSKEYEQSKNCKFECERIKEFKKPFIALQMETYQRRRGSWVKQLIKDHFYVNFTNNTNKVKFNESFNELLRVLRITERKIAEQQLQDLRSKAGPSQDGSGGASSSQQQPAGGSGGASSSQQPCAEGIPEAAYGRLLTTVSSWWNDHGNIDMLKILLRQFIPKITKTDLERTNNLMGLFTLMKGIRSEKVAIIFEAVKICGLEGVDINIRKIETFKNFTFEDINSNIFSSYHKKMIKFGKIVSVNSITTIGFLFNISDRVHKGDPWLLIWALMKGKLKENSMAEFIQALKENGMTEEAEELESS